MQWYDILCHRELIHEQFQQPKLTTQHLTLMPWLLQEDEVEELTLAEIRP